MSFLTPAIEQELTDAVAACEKSRLLIAHDPESLTAAAVWVEVQPNKPPRMTRWAMSGPMPADAVESFATDIVQTLSNTRTADGQSVTIN